MSSREEEYLLGAGIANSRKLLQRFLCLSERPLQDTVEISVEFLQRDLCNAPELFDSRFGANSTKPCHFKQGFFPSSENLSWNQPNFIAKRVESKLTPLIADKIGHVLE